MKTLLDTHALIWLMEGSERLGKRAAAAIDRARQAGEAAVSAITFWEVAVLEQRRRVGIDRTLAAWRRAVLDAGILEIPIGGEIALQAGALGDALRDPGDRFIVATALREDRVLVTADQAILDWQGKLGRLDASR
ncbi:MAG: PilT protein domain protein [Alphaproteobacteria bacterium]|nr:PilT protein domain protein [Alphaproteobacteria bacterium]